MYYDPDPAPQEEAAGASENHHVTRRIEEWEWAYWADKYGVSPQRLKEEFSLQRHRNQEH